MRHPITDIIMIGNGFDLHYSFPTKYVNFLHTANFLIKHHTESFDTVGHIFAHEELHSKDNEIKNASDLYNDSYLKVDLDQKQLEKFSSNAQQNKWFAYLSHMLSKSSGWIDVEKEIATALKLFNEILEEAERFYDKIVIGEETLLNGAKTYIINIFDFFWDPENMLEEYGLNVDKKVIKPEFRLEVPKGSENYIVDKNKIASSLFEELMKLATLLNTYLSWFIDEPMLEIAKGTAVKKDVALDGIKETPIKVITFNYTHTWEKLYPTSDTSDFEIAHIHGEATRPTKMDKVNDTIVLGINRDKNDDPESIDTTFIDFKKYYQRVVFSTNRPYQRLYEQIKQKAEKKEPNIKDAGDKKTYRLLVIGHSLDVTDKDIIIELFSFASSIVVYYYDQKDKKDKVENLVKIYGDSGLRTLQTDKHLKFLDLCVLQSKGLDEGINEDNEV